LAQYNKAYSVCRLMLGLLSIVLESLIIKSGASNSLTLSEGKVRPRVKDQSQSSASLDVTLATGLLTQQTQATSKPPRSTQSA
jgi:hypothetical protein